MTSAPHYQDGPVTLYLGDCLDVLRELPDESVHAVVTDPPYGLDFMGKGWDAPGKMLGQISVGHEQRGAYAYGGTHSRGYADHDAGQFGEWCRLWALECLRVLKPGGHLVAFGGSRTWHRLAAGIEDAGFDIRDSIAWLYGSGFPKSMDVAKAIDKAERGVPQGGSDPSSANHGKYRTTTTEGKRWDGDSGQGYGAGGSRFLAQHGTDSGSATEPVASGGVVAAAEPWQGWGTALKPAFEPIVVARKPLAGTVAANVLAHGTGALNIDATRIKSGDTLVRPSVTRADNTVLGSGLGAGVQAEPGGRWPANVVLEESQAAELDRQAPDTGGSGRASGPTLRGATDAGAAFGARNGLPGDREPAFYGDRGGASRMFPTFHYEAKAPTSERPVVDGVAHPTVKPLDLMRWLVRLVTPRGGTVLEPFAGSGTTVEAAVMEGFNVIGIEREPTYMPLIEKRIRKDHAQGFDIDWGDAS